MRWAVQAGCRYAAARGITVLLCVAAIAAAAETLGELTAVALPSKHILSIASGNATVFAGTESGIVRLHDGASAYDMLPELGDKLTPRVEAIAIDPVLNWGVASRTVRAPGSNATTACRLMTFRMDPLQRFHIFHFDDLDVPPPGAPPIPLRASFVAMPRHPAFADMFVVVVEAADPADSLAAPVMVQTRLRESVNTVATGSAGQRLSGAGGYASAFVSTDAMWWAEGEPGFVLATWVLLSGGGGYASMVVGALNTSSADQQLWEWRTAELSVDAFTGAAGRAPVTALATSRDCRYMFLGLATSPASYLGLAVISSTEVEVSIPLTRLPGHGGAEMRPSASLPWPPGCCCPQLPTPRKPVRTWC